MEELRQQFRSIQRTTTGKQAPPVNLQNLQTELEKYQQWATSNQQIVESRDGAELTHQRIFNEIPGGSGGEAGPVCDPGRDTATIKP